MWQHATPLLLLLLISAPPSSSTPGNERVQLTQQLQQLQTSKRSPLAFGTLHPNSARTQSRKTEYIRIPRPTNLFARAELWLMHLTLQGRAVSSRLPREGRAKPRLWVIRKHQTPRTASRLGRGFMKGRCAPFFEGSPREAGLFECMHAATGKHWCYRRTSLAIVWVGRIFAMR